MTPSPLLSVSVKPFSSFVLPRVPAIAHAVEGAVIPHFYSRLLMSVAAVGMGLAGFMNALVLAAVRPWLERGVSPPAG